MAAMSAPATNDLSPPPVSTTTRTDVVGAQLARRGEQQLVGLGVERVERLGAVHGDDGDGAVAVDVHGHV